MVITYTESLIKRKLCFGTINNHLSGIKTVLTWMGVDPRIWESPKLKWNRRSARLVLRREDTPKPSMNFEHFVVCLYITEDLKDAHLHLALIFAYFGLLRCSNLTVQKRGEVDSTRDILLTDVTDMDSHLIIKIKWSKANQTRSDTLVLPTTISNIYLGFKKSKNLPLLMNRSLAPIHGDLLRSLFKDVFRRAGLAGSVYTPHTLRRGGTSFYADNGVPLDAIHRHGLWRSEAIEVYLKKMTRHQCANLSVVYRLLHFRLCKYSYLSVWRYISYLHLWHSKPMKIYILFVYIICMTQNVLC